jgi:transporter family-2 protein
LVTAFTILVATQFIGGAMIDHWGLMGAEVRLLDLPKLIGIGVLLMGVWLIIR